jgi:hypothetical protein
MDVTAVMAEVAAAGRTVAGLTVYEWETPGRYPAAVVALPERFDPNGTYNRGLAMLEDLPFIVLLGRADSRTSTKLLTDYLADSGTRAVVPKLQNYAYTKCDVVTVTHVDFDTYTLAAVDLLAATFHLNIAGKGS